MTDSIVRAAQAMHAEMLRQETDTSGHMPVVYDANDLTDVKVDGRLDLIAIAAAVAAEYARGHVNAEIGFSFTSGDFVDPGPIETSCGLQDGPRMRDMDGEAPCRPVTIGSMRTEVSDYQGRMFVNVSLPLKHSVEPPPTILSEWCACLGPQGDAPFCPCRMRTLDPDYVAPPANHSSVAGYSLTPTTKEALPPKREGQ